MIKWAPGYTQGELDDAQERYGLRFPPDLVDLLLDHRPSQAWDWRTDHEGIRRALEHPLGGLLFDLEHNGLWWPEWGDRPATSGERAEILTAVVNSAPQLVPIYSHRYIPETPHESGNPVFSVMQSDVVYYGANLADYLEREFNRPPFPWKPITNARFIPFWSDLVERNR